MTSAEAGKNQVFKVLCGVSAGSEADIIREEIIYATTENGGNAMAEAYVCGACGVTMKNPYEVKMREFYVGVRYDFHSYEVNVRTPKQKVHLCDECYLALRAIAARIRRKDDGK